ncbi:uncharacterized protein LY79DRAFT_283709 [Colletotrichum navitas]|uniref:Uncharacterized protein n=1 Tax=Colletotrichum navitas TaxID=681940 RepID=A0AAD8Q9G6_9PEZI|nr:uncharacterized protein LY79DRAFT_283709 [Colletotrichum navitas]KAK1598225.1 hypothetical protein LY79DRAFT_283709 [Colletotrichum navitas]
MELRIRSLSTRFDLESAGSRSGAAPLYRFGKFMRRPSTDGEGNLNDVGAWAGRQRHLSRHQKRPGDGQITDTCPHSKQVTRPSQSRQDSGLTASNFTLFTSIISTVFGENKRTSRPLIS